MALTIVEMLVAMAITLLIMAAVVTVFANVSNSVTRRRATIEMSSALRNVRETLARDLAGATCPAVPWQRPESNVGYIEIIEGPQNDYYPTPWLFDGDGDGVPDPIGNVPGIELALSSLPGSNLGGTPANDFTGHGLVIGSNTPIGPGTSLENTPTDGRGLGDGDDTLMLTVRNEEEPFVGRIPIRSGNASPSAAAFANWGNEEIESPLAEVVWYALENPVDPNRTFAFGEPGYRTIYRRALLILPDVDYGIDVIPGGVDTNPGNVAGVLAGPGAVRVLPPDVDRTDVSQAIACLISFQERYDLSVRLEWDPLLPSSNTEPGRWVLKSNTLGDLTERENRYEHHGYIGIAAAYGTIDRYYPFALASGGVTPNSVSDVLFVSDPEIGNPAEGAEFQTVVAGLPAALGGGYAVVAYEPSDTETTSMDRVYGARPFALVNYSTASPCTARAVLNEVNQVVHVTRGLVPLGGSRRGEDVMMTDALAFDLKVYDPGAPIYRIASGTDFLIVGPNDPAWPAAILTDANGPAANGDVAIDTFESQGAYVDLGYGKRSPAFGVSQRYTGDPLLPVGALNLVAPIAPQFWRDGFVRLPSQPTSTAAPLTTLYANYDTWSWHYENDGINQDRDSGPNGRPTVDEGANGLDDPDPTIAGDPRLVDNAADIALYGPDDFAERETRPPYDAALRGLQVSLRAYERDSRQIREVRVKESFVPE
ncbi:PilW family protein [Botrimarina mediterranea]|uniref:PilW family protein n=1 Tax=Botrimarina mediterranea TaxID=2528022 RepID=UPI00118C159A|nr:hypothetical protein K2D_35800 [Planctomycetes bacterium K2D]